MKKMICGVLLAVIGFGFALVSIIYALMNPLGIPSLFSCLLYTSYYLGGSYIIIDSQ